MRNWLEYRGFLARPSIFMGESSMTEGDRSQVRTYCTRQRINTLETAPNTIVLVTTLVCFLFMEPKVPDYTLRFRKKVTTGLLINLTAPSDLESAPVTLHQHKIILPYSFSGKKLCRSYLLR